MSTGQMIREAIRDSGARGEACETFIDKGQLMPDEIVITVVEQWLNRQGSDSEFIMDGFTRTQTQAVTFDQMLVKRQQGKSRAVLLDVSPAETVCRIRGRRCCGNCGALYHLEFDPPRQTDVCDRCGGELARRVDDTEPTVRERLRVYQTMTGPMVKHDRRAGVLVTVVGSQGTSLVFAELPRMVRS